MTASQEYVSDIGYTYGYYEELNPIRLDFTFALQGIQSGKLSKCCELGFGQGISINFHSTIPTIKFYGNDFNKKHVNFANTINSLKEAKAELSDKSFSEYVYNDDLPEFDFIMLHGIWSWVAQSNRDVILEFIGNKLKVGGVLYISYNTQPGWLDALPIRSLLTDFAKRKLPDKQPTYKKIEESKRFLVEFLETSPQFVKSRPLINKRLDLINSQNPEYLAHEFFNETWEPFSFGKIYDMLTDIGLDYACSADLKNELDFVNFSTDQQTFLANIEDISLRETIKDFTINQSFRKEYWVKGLLSLSHKQQMEILSQFHIILLKPVDDIELKVEGKFVSGDLNKDLYQPVLRFLSNHKIVTIQSLFERVSFDVESPTEVIWIEILKVLFSIGVIAPVHDSSVIKKSSMDCKVINHHLLTVLSDRINFLVSPVTGGGVYVSNVNLLFISAIEKGLSTSDDIISFSWQQLQDKGERVVKDGKPLKTEDENLAELVSNLEVFEKDYRKIYSTLKLI